MSKSSLLQKVLDEIAHQSTFNTANILILLSAGGWLASSLAQVVGIYRNKNYTKEEKSFMIPQELADAVVNIGAFLLVTKSLKSLTSKMVETGKLAPKSIQTFLGEKGLLSERGKFDFNLTTVDGFQKHINTYNTFKTVAESTAAIVGGILSSNIITPILRNKIGAKRKDVMMKKLGYTENTTEQVVQQPISTGEISTARHTFEDFQRDVQISRVPQENPVARARFEAFRNGGMRI